jgi:hypothetical protein
MSLIIIDTENETFEETVERIAKIRHEDPCPEAEREFCNPDLHVWDTAHPEDKEWGRKTVAFILREVGYE